MSMTQFTMFVDAAEIPDYIFSPQIASTSSTMC